MYRFELLTGDHYDGQNKILYTAQRDGPPTIVRSEDRLDRMFRNKFRFLGAEERPAEAPKSNTSAEVFTPLRNGEYLLEDSPTPTAPPIVVDAKAAPKLDPQEWGEEVTEDFPAAASHDLRVFKRRAGRFVITKSDPAEIVGAANGYIGQANVRKVIAKYSETVPATIK